eukprot:TRINITY_DN4424_c0_g1_i2.p1 TRINITY_DN4424_c0_g1~~TRINITY_DN4424_c0_g1_i2.p1  ORF type:complete len:979 (+),score=182.68 TRINITY_DN4424_c0_g1_i2:91-3027(+)
MLFHQWPSALAVVAVVLHWPGAAGAAARLPWRLHPVEDARSIESAAEADSHQALVATVAKGSALYVQAWAEAGEALEARLFQRLLPEEKALSASLVLIAPLNASWSLPRGFQQFGSSSTEEQIQEPAAMPGTTYCYQFWAPPREPEAVGDPFLPRGDALLAKARHVARITGWHYWVAAVMEETTLSCQVETSSQDCKAYVALSTGANEVQDWGPWEMLLFPGFSSPVHRWEGISSAAEAAPALGALVSVLFGLYRLRYRWRADDKCGASSFMPADAVLPISAALFSASALHRFFLGVTYLSRGVMPLGDFMLTMLLVLFNVAFCAFSYGCWAHVCKELTWPTSWRAFLAVTSLVALPCFGAGFALGPLLGALAAVLPEERLTEDLEAYLAGVLKYLPRVPSCKELCEAFGLHPGRAGFKKKRWKKRNKVVPSMPPAPHAAWSADEEKRQPDLEAAEEVPASCSLPSECSTVPGEHVWRSVQPPPMRPPDAAAACNGDGSVPIPALDLHLQDNSDQAHARDISSRAAAAGTMQQPVTIPGEVTRRQAPPFPPAASDARQSDGIWRIPVLDLRPQDKADSLPPLEIIASTGAAANQAPFANDEHDVKQQSQLSSQLQPHDHRQEYASSSSRSGQGGAGDAEVKASEPEELPAEPSHRAADIIKQLPRPLLSAALPDGRAGRPSDERSKWQQVQSAAQESQRSESTKVAPASAPLSPPSTGTVDSSLRSQRSESTKVAPASAPLPPPSTGTVDSSLREHEPCPVSADDCRSSRPCSRGSSGSRLVVQKEEVLASSLAGAEASRGGAKVRMSSPSQLAALQALRKAGRRQPSPGLRSSDRPASRPSSSHSSVQGSSCSNCGNSHLPDEIFCRRCGHKRASDNKEDSGGWEPPECGPQHERPNSRSSRHGQATGSRQQSPSSRPPLPQREQAGRPASREMRPATSRLQPPRRPCTPPMQTTTPSDQTRGLSLDLEERRTAQGM